MPVPTPSSQWEKVEVPALRIVDQVLWDKAEARQASVSFLMGKDAQGQALNRANRRRFLLSGLLSCGSCGGGYTIISPGRYGCAAHRSKGTCSNSSTITRQHIEARVLSGLKDHMLAPEVVAEFVRAFAQEAASIQAETSGTQTRLTGEAADVKRLLDGVLTAIENGAWSTTLQTRLNELEERKADLGRQLANCAGANTIVTLHPNAADIYKIKVAELEIALADPEIALEAGEALASMIDKIILTPCEGEPDSLRVDLYGDLAAILFAAGAGHGGDKQERPRLGAVNGTGTGGLSEVMAVVAGACNHLDLLLGASS